MRRNKSNCRILLKYSRLLCFNSLFVMIAVSLALASFDSMGSDLMASFPELGKRIYSLPADLNSEEGRASVTKIIHIEEGHTGLKDPISNRDIEFKTIIGKSRYMSEMQLDETKPKVKSAFITLAPLSIMGTSNEPSMQLRIERQRVETSDAVLTPGLLKGIYKDAKKLK